MLVILGLTLACFSTKAESLFSSRNTQDEVIPLIIENTGVDPSTPKDEVSGYSAMLLNGILINGSTSLDNLQRNLYPLPVGVTKDQVDTLFSYYITNWNE